MTQIPKTLQQKSKISKNCKKSNSNAKNNNKTSSNDYFNIFQVLLIFIICIIEIKNYGETSRYIDYKCLEISDFE